MPRRARQISGSGMYHVVMRGINRQTIFEDTEDSDKFLGLLFFYKDRCGFRIHAFCLMGNHIHLLIEVTKDPLSSVFKKIGTSYAQYFNQKYGRVGHLFQDRFKSEAVEDDARFLSVLRYIHMNPVKAGICHRPGEYVYSSYQEYTGSRRSILVYRDLAMGMLSPEEFIRYTEDRNQDIFLDVSDITGGKITDDAAKEMIRRITGCGNASEFQTLSDRQRDDALKEIVQRGVMINQAARLTGWSRTVVRRALQK